jgi:hypothetical protein
LAIKAQAADLERRAAAVREAEELTSLARSKPAELFRRLGVSPEEMANLILADGKPDPLSEAKRVRSEFEQYKQQQAEAQRQAQVAQQRQTLQQFERETVAFVAADPARWELIAASGSADAVVQRVVEHHRKYGEILDVDKAADEVERELEARVEKLAATKKWQSKAKPPAPPAPPKAVSNAIAPAAGSKPPTRLTDDERKERALARLAELQGLTRK